MQDLFISVNDNKLRLSAVDTKTGFKSVTEELTQNTVAGSLIVDPMTFSSILSESISKVTKQPKNRLLLNFILEPQDVFLRFFTLNKGTNGDDAQIISEIKKKLEDVNLDDLYFSYQKIAPFLYQFVGVRKNILESFLDVSNSVGIGLKSIVPWPLLLPKYVDSIVPSVFVVKRDSGQVVALSELSGVFFAGVYEGERTSKELKEFLTQVSFYRKTEPINNLYSLNYESLSLSDFNTTKIALPVAEIDSEGTLGYEINIMTNFMMDKDTSIVSGQSNAVNLLPLPAVVKKPAVMVYVGSIVMGLALVGTLVFFGVLKRPHNDTGNLAQNTETQQAVLSENTTSESTGTVKPESSPELKKSDLKIRVENGTEVPGLAAKTRDLLNGLGYDVVGIGDADESRKDTLLKFKADKFGFKTVVTEDSKEKFGNMVVEDGLKGDAEYDLLVIIGEDVNL